MRDMEPRQRLIQVVAQCIRDFAWDDASATEQAEYTLDAVLDELDAITDEWIDDDDTAIRVMSDWFRMLREGSA